jgi:hypothetical protein
MEWMDDQGGRMTEWMEWNEWNGMEWNGME